MEMLCEADLYEPSSLHLNKYEDFMYLMPDHHNPRLYICNLVSSSKDCLCVRLMHKPLLSFVVINFTSLCSPKFVYTQSYNQETHNHISCSTI